MFDLVSAVQKIESKNDKWVKSPLVAWQPQNDKTPGSPAKCFVQNKQTRYKVLTSEL